MPPPHVCCTRGPNNFHTNPIENIKKKNSKQRKSNQRIRNIGIFQFREKFIILRVFGVLLASFDIADLDLDIDIDLATLQKTHSILIK